MCLAAEKCGHLDFDVRSDMWWRSQGFHCGDTPAGEVSFADIFWKVPTPHGRADPDWLSMACCTATLSSVGVQYFCRAALQIFTACIRRFVWRCFCSTSLIV